MNELRQLNKKHQAFILEYVKNGNNGTQAYLYAYPNAKETTARANANKLLTNSEIVEHIQRLQDEYLKNAILSTLELEKVLSDIVMSDKSSNTDKIKSIDTLNKMRGVYTQKIELPQFDCKWSKQK